MVTSTTEIRTPQATDVSLTEDTLTVDLSDGRTISVPLLWFPRLTHGTDEERNHWELVGNGEGIHWPELDEDISVEGLLAGWRSAESPTSLRQWRNERHHAHGNIGGSLLGGQDD